MLLRQRDITPDPAYPPDEWRYVETRFDERSLAANESLMAVSNGYLGIRGCHDEHDPVVASGTFVNGFYESWVIEYPEEAYGLARKGQTMVNVADAHIMRLFVDDEPLYLPTAELLEYERALHMGEGTLDRDLVWLTNSGKRVRLSSRRLASFEHRHVAAVWYRVSMLDTPAAIDVVSEIDCRFEDSRRGGRGDPRAGRVFDARVLEPRHHEHTDRRMILGYATRRSEMSLACGVDHAVSADCEITERVMCDESLGKIIFSAKMQPGHTVTIAKFIVFHSSRRTRAEELTGRVHRTLDRVVADGIDELMESQRRRVAALWDVSDIEIRDDAAAQQAIRFNQFQLMQATVRAEGNGVPAKGLTGQGYEGHYFWDTEVYVLPYLVYTEPLRARNVLKFRFSQLEKARQRAREVSERGALFPWRTISGDEASAYYAAGTAQYHINADIVYALRKYVEATGDEQLLFESGAEILVETARFWRYLGFFSERRDGAFCINGVTGPDEYNTVVNNNLYTNLMARENLWYAADVIERIRRDHPEVLDSLRRRTGLEDGEAAEWRRAADRMYVPYDEERGIHPQDDAFLDKESWDFDGTPGDEYPLLLHHHPLVIYRHRVVKQADVVLAMFLLGDKFSLEEKRRNFDFYDPLTTGDSSLSVCVQAVLAAELGYEEKAFNFGRYALLMDLANINDNVEDGCHIASMGGTWMMMVYGLAGFRDHRGQFGFAPTRPGRFRQVRIPLRLRDCVLQVDLGRDAVRYTLREGERSSFQHYEEPVTLEGAGASVERSYA